MIHGAAAAYRVDTESSNCLRTPEKESDRVGIVEMQIKQCAAAESAVHKPVFPGIAGDIGRETGKSGTAQSAELAGLVKFPGISVFRPIPDTHADREKLAGFPGFGNNCFGFFYIAG